MSTRIFFPLTIPIIVLWVMMIRNISTKPCFPISMDVLGHGDTEELGIWRGILITAARGKVEGLWSGVCVSLQYQSQQ
jgi:hypothetical protein